MSAILSRQIISKENTMIRKIILTLFTAVALLAEDSLPIDTVKEHLFAQKLEVNSQIIQLSSAKQEVASLLAGHLERYFVKPSQKVKKGQKVALIDSPELSKMTASYLALKQQYAAQKKNYDSVERLYEKGMTSLQELNRESIKKDALLSELNTLESQLHSIGVDPKVLTKPTSAYTLYAHTSGIVSELEIPLHSSVDRERGIISIVKEHAYYAKSYVPLKYAKDLKKGDRIVLEYFGKQIASRITQILPEVDSETKRAVALSSIESDEKLFIGAFVASTIYFGEKKHYLAVKRSALSFFNNEWVVFLPKGEEHDEHGEKEEHDEEGEEHEHEHEHEHDAPYTLQVVHVITQDDKYVAIEGLTEGQEYISDKSYYAKSAILKGSLGEHGH